MLERIAELAPALDENPIIIPNAPVSQATRAFNEADSQVSSRDATPARAAIARVADIGMD